LEKIRSRRKTKKIYKGKVAVGGGSRISVQSMTTTPTHRVDETVRQIKRLEAVGCDIARVAVPTEKDAAALSKIRERVNVPIVADIHFSHRLAIKAIEAGADCVRVNPGNLGGLNKAREVFAAARRHGISVRIGVNSGSIRPRKGGVPVGRKPIAELMAETIMKYAASAERTGLDQIILSAKCANVIETIETNRLIARGTDWPIHLGVTAAGTPETALVRNSIGIGILLAEGIGDTIRVSMTASPVEEVLAGLEILDSLGLAPERARLISCPTCGRCSINLEALARKVRKRIARVRTPISVAVMGCVVNGPGEASEADVGIAGGKGFGLFFERGKKTVKVPEEKLTAVLFEAIDRIEREKQNA